MLSSGRARLAASRPCCTTSGQPAETDGSGGGDRFACKLLIEFRPPTASVRERVRSGKIVRLTRTRMAEKK